MASSPYLQTGPVALTGLLTLGALSPLAPVGTAEYAALAALLIATGPDCVPGYRRLAEACHRHGAKLFAQLFHPGREILESIEAGVEHRLELGVWSARRFVSRARSAAKRLVGGNKNGCWI